jgi:membrane protease YdiL (CAAX protease family)
MTWRGIFLSDDQLRPIWRCLLSVVMIVLAFLLVSAALGFLFRAVRGSVHAVAAYSWFSVLMLPALLGIFKLLTGIFDRRSLGSVGVAFHPRWRAELGRGLVVGAVMILLIAGMEAALGLAHFGWSAESPGHILEGGAVLGFLLLVAAANEELVFRGYPFQRLMDAIGPVGAIAVFSALFGLGHLANPEHTWISTLNTMLVGIPLAVAYLRTRALWMPIGLHLAWNFLEGYALGLPVSGLNLSASVFTSMVSGPRWVTGGAYGPEGGVLATGVILAATFYLLASRRIYITEEMKRLVFGPPRVVAAEPPVSLLSLTGSREEG